MKKLTKPMDDLKRTGWQCQACKVWNAMTRKMCWHCQGPPETRVPGKMKGE